MRLLGAARLFQEHTEDLSSPPPLFLFVFFNVSVMYAETVGKPLRRGF